MHLAFYSWSFIITAMNLLLVIVIVMLLIVASAVCSGLNIALMSIDAGDLKRKTALGDPAAIKVFPLRKNMHLTLASILLTNVAVISATSLVLEHKLSGLIAGLLSTVLIVVFGEVIPQAIFAKKALAFASFFSPILKIMIIMTYPISKPLQLILDRLVGHQAHPLQTRHELGLLITEHLGHKSSELDEDEVEIMRGALSLSEKRVREIMTKLEKVYWLTPDTIINGRRIDEIKSHARSRIPVLSRDMTQSYGILLMKELVDIDFDEQPRRVDELPLHRTKIVGSMTALDTMFRKFISARAHLMLVERDEHLVGIVTIEDLIEEIIGHEIEDETDHLRT